MTDERLSIENLAENEEDADVMAGQSSLDPDEFFLKNAFRIVYQTNNFFLPQLRDLIDKGAVLNLRPEYQRRLRWTPSQKSRLIESLLLNIPIPPIFLYESDAARYEVMDGQQRLNAVREFLVGGFALTGLEVLTPLNGLRYPRCPPRIKRALDRASISAIVLLLESEPSGLLSPVDVRRFIFNRLNTGGTKLNQQEVRNAIYPGLFNDALVELSRFSLFTDCFEIPAYIEADPNDYYENEDRQTNSLYSSMADCQLVLRYFALKDDTNIRSSMKSMLDRAMEQRMKIDKNTADALQEEFKDRFSFLYTLFNTKPFRLAADEQGRRRISASLYDSSMVAMDRLWTLREEVHNDILGAQARMTAALTNEASLTTLTGQGNTAKAVRERISLLVSILKPQP